ncbi:MAG: PIN domain-containing protein [Chloroflexi bacterium]|nr:PIN domain-containing protein [Chloroflexota bacterium]MYB17344.1 PIN domain-containing protein [Chloroflexota bacterium]
MFDDVNTGKRDRARQLVGDAIGSGEGVISHQVVQEALNVLASKLGATAGQQLEIFDNVLCTLWRIPPTADLYRRAVAVSERYRFGFYDSLVIAAALEYGCDFLYSEDLQHGQVVDTVTIRNPFLDLN